MTPADNFIKDEKSGMNWLEKVFMNYPEMFSTKELAGAVNAFQIEQEKTIHPSTTGRIIPVLFLFFSIGCWLILFNLFINKVLIYVTISALLFVSLIIWVIIWNTFLNRKYIYTIRLNKVHIEIDKKIIPWTDISGTYIMIRQSGRGRASHLVIFTNDERAYKYSLFAFGITDQKLSALIEFYKGTHAQTV